MANATIFDAAVIGGGVVGAAVACGLLGAGLSTCILDEGDVAHRASRGNFALIWVQSKGLGMARYGSWTRASADAWADFAADLRAETGIDVAHQRPGGFSLCLSEEELEKRRGALTRMHNQPGWIPYDWEVLDRPALMREFPDLGPEVVGGLYCPLDGHVNSLRLFRALHAAFKARGGAYFPERPVTSIAPLSAGGFRIETPKGAIEAGKLVLAAGIANARLAPMVGLVAPVRPQRGQILVTEKTAPFLRHPVITVRQTDEGGVMIGDSAEEAGLDERIGLGVLSVMADRAMRMFPRIAALNVVRTWAALRVMSQDGFPIYDRSESAPGAFIATCHSGVTLAAAHERLLAPMIARGALDADMAPFSARRFDVPQAA
ncbi:NAD(P)/FAD-dependent oxidoreductase [Neoroseomonas soli]|uniref:FAD-binding oxidoreductase n=1 Tax=Neoroseomonas soli TaxID=1081025 RepID=A0A9X9WTL2_9PROT|nr:FAD-dependent oxidoreductase [Neoroseomonas soli]MBR0670491.1 FAD-binding oxidoreductase [Neoroseomonas soli]